MSMRAQSIINGLFFFFDLFTFVQLSPLFFQKLHCSVSPSDLLFLVCRVNVTLGPREDRVLMTGLHTVCDIHCTICDSVLGWKYEHAFEESQKYKEGKFIIEKAKILKVM